MTVSLTNYIRSYTACNQDVKTPLNMTIPISTVTFICPLPSTEQRHSTVYNCERFKIKPHSINVNINKKRAALHYISTWASESARSFFFTS